MAFPSSIIYTPQSALLFVITQPFAFLVIISEVCSVWPSRQRQIKPWVITNQHEIRGCRTFTPLQASASQLGSLWFHIHWLALQILVSGYAPSAPRDNCNCKEGINRTQAESMLKYIHTKISDLYTGSWSHNSQTMGVIPFLCDMFLYIYNL